MPRDILDSINGLDSQPCESQLVQKFLAKVQHEGHQPASGNLARANVAISNWTTVIHTTLTLVVPIFASTGKAMIGYQLSIDS